MVIAQALYEAEKKRLMGREVVTSTRLTWKVRGDVKKEEIQLKDDSEYDMIGIKNFDFKDDYIRCNNGEKTINFLDLLIHLRPGDWCELLKN